METSSTPDQFVEHVNLERPVSMLIWIALPFFVSAYQLMAKVVADRSASAVSGTAWLIRILTQPLTFALIASEIVSFALWMYVLSRMQLSEAFPLSAISYVFVILSSWTIFHETGSIGQVMGTAAILVGAWLIARPQEATD